MCIVWVCSGGGGGGGGGIFGAAVSIVFVMIRTGARLRDARAPQPLKL